MSRVVRLIAHGTFIRKQLGLCFIDYEIQLIIVQELHEYNSVLEIGQSMKTENMDTRLKREVKMKHNG